MLALCGLSALAGGLAACSSAPGDRAGFEAVPELEVCALARARHPERVLDGAELRWTACGERQACERAVVRGQEERWTVLLHPSSAVGSTPFFLIRERTEDRDAPFIDLLTRADGQALAAFRHDRRCELAYASGENALALIVEQREREDGTSSLLVYFAAGDGELLFDEPSPRLELPAGSSLWTAAASSWGVVLQLVGAGTRFIGEGARGDEADDSAELGARLRLIGEEALWSQQGGSPPEIRRRAPGEDAEIYYRIADERATLKGFDVEGDRLAWLEEHEPDDREPGRYARCELWTARYAERGAELEPHKVADMAEPNAGCSLVDNGSLGTDLYAYTQDGELRIFELDGACERRMQVPEPYGKDVRPELFADQLFLRAVTDELPVGRMAIEEWGCLDTAGEP